MGKPILPYPRLLADGAGTGAVSQAGAVLLLRTAGKIGLLEDLSEALRRASHDPGKIVLDLAVSLAVGGDCVSDLDLIRAEPGVFGSVTSDSTVSRTVAALAADAPKALAAIASVRRSGTGAGWGSAGEAAPDHGIGIENPVTIDLAFSGAVFGDIAEPQ
ncbi:transposase [Nocardia salmonicida]|uniref:transposase n=1 Tax=Nocardia salmonicida TaxID=53431 RepID=UPI0007A527DB